VILINSIGTLLNDFNFVMKTPYYAYIRQKPTGPVC